MATYSTEREVILPLADNDGASLRDVHTDFQNFLLKIAGGYSQQSIDGAWKDGDRVYLDHSIKYIVTLPKEQDKVLTASLPFWCQRARQLMLFTQARSVRVAYVAPNASTVHELPTAAASLAQ
jgi:hypothetical protein